MIIIPFFYRRIWVGVLVGKGILYPGKPGVPSSNLTHTDAHNPLASHFLNNEEIRAAPIWIFPSDLLLNIWSFTLFCF